MTTKPTLTAERLREVLEYDPETGVFTWREGGGAARPVGTPVGSAQNRGYWAICVDYRKYLAHRLAWLYVTGEWPSRMVDHVNGNKLDNRFANLREATNSQNQQNRRGGRTGSKSGLLGVKANGHGWTATIQRDGVIRRLGTYRTREEAHRAYLAAKRELHPYYVAH